MPSSSTRGRSGARELAGGLICGRGAGEGLSDTPCELLTQGRNVENHARDQIEPIHRPDAGAGEEADDSISIDAYREQSGIAPSLLKIDAEGRDLDVLAGAVRTLERARPVVVFELQSCMIDALSATKPADLFPCLERLGYVPHLFRGHTVLAVEAVDFRILPRI